MLSMNAVLSIKKKFAIWIEIYVSSELKRQYVCRVFNCVWFRCIHKLHIETAGVSQYHFLLLARFFDVMTSHSNCYARSEHRTSLHHFQK